jgi:hypothetical protein
MYSCIFQYFLGRTEWPVLLRSRLRHPPTENIYTAAECGLELALSTIFGVQGARFTRYYVGTNAARSHSRPAREQKGRIQIHSQGGG